MVLTRGNVKPSRSSTPSTAVETPVSSPPAVNVDDNMDDRDDQDNLDDQDDVLDDDDDDDDQGATEPAANPTNAPANPTNDPANPPANPANAPIKKHNETSSHPNLPPYFSTRRCSKWNFTHFVVVTDGNAALWQSSLATIRRCRNKTCCPPEVRKRANDLAGLYKRMKQRHVSHASQTRDFT